MSHPFPNIISDVKASHVVAVEPFRGYRGVYGLGMASADKYWFIPRKDWWDEFLKELFACKCTFVCYDMRRLLDMHIEQAAIVDMRTVLDEGDSLLRSVQRTQKNNILVSQLSEYEQRMSANLRALRTMGVQLNGNLTETMPPEFFEKYLRARTLGVRALFNPKSKDLDSWWRRLDFVRAVHEVELNGIRVDKEFIDTMLTKRISPAEAKCFRSMQQYYRDGFVTSFYNAAGTKTGRLRPGGGFNSMGIPHGQCRKAIISRFEGGQIYSFDYNAIDYRSIVSSISGAFADLYRESKDFHTRTAQFLFKDVDEVRREAIKAISYTSIYGGSEATLADRTGLSMEMVRNVLAKLEPHMRPIHEFRDKLWGLFQVNGEIEIPGVGTYRKDDDEPMHPGKLLALYAQGYSAYVFERAFVGVNRYLNENGNGSCIIFPVHDELVLDVHPDDEAAGVVEKVRSIMEKGLVNDFVVNIKKGRSYGEVVG